MVEEIGVNKSSIANVYLIKKQHFVYFKVVITYILIAKNKICQKDTNTKVSHQIEFITCTLTKYPVPAATRPR